MKSLSPIQVALYSYIGKKAQNNALAEEMKFLAAVLMIQRNYRKKKARGEL